MCIRDSTTLGARGVRYEIDFYGRMTTAIERGEESDRCLVRWDLRSPRVEAAARGEVAALDLDAARAAGAPVLISVADDGSPVTGDPAGDGPALVQVHPDIEQLRIDAPDTAGDWRRAVRDTLGQTMQSGHHLTAAARDGWYLVEPA